MFSMAYCEIFFYIFILVLNLPTLSMSFWIKLQNLWKNTSEEPSLNFFTGLISFSIRYDLAQKFCQRALEQEADHPRWGT